MPNDASPRFTGSRAMALRRLKEAVAAAERRTETRAVVRVQDIKALLQRMEEGPCD